MKKKNNKIIIIFSVIVLLAVVGIGGYFLVDNINSNKSVGTDWGDIYYEYLTHDYDKELDDGFELKKSEVQFIPREDKDPIMAVYFAQESKDKKEYYRYHFFYIDENKHASSYDGCGASGGINLELLYNRKEEKYKWYAVMEWDTEMQYIDIEKRLEMIELRRELGGYEKTKDNEEHKKLEEESIIRISKTDLPPEKIEEATPISKFEEIFIKVEDAPELEKVNITDIKDLKKFKNELSGLVNNYKPMEKVITKEVKQDIANAIEAMDSRKAAYDKKVEEEKAAEEAKRAADEAARKAAEDARKNSNSFKVGNYTLSYGTYIGSGGFQGSMNGAKFTLNSDGTYNDGRHSGTFTANSCGYLDFDGGQWTYRVLGDNVFGNPASYDEKFTFVG